MLMPFRYLIKKPKQGEKMDNAQELKAHLQDRNKARIYAEKKNKHNVLIARIYEENEKQQSLRIKKFDQELKEQFEEQANSMSKQKLIDFYVETMIEGEQ